VNFDQLSAFVSIFETGGYERAARALGNVSQGGVSARIRRLEDELGVDLFELVNRKTRPTEAGRSLYNLIRGSIAELARVPALLKEEITGTPQGTVNVGAGEVGCMYILPGKVWDFLRSFPDVRVAISNQLHEETITMLRNGELDFGLRGFPGTSVPDDLFYRELPFSNLVALIPASFAIAQQEDELTLEDLLQYPLIMPPGNSRIRRDIAQRLKKRFEAAVRLEVGGSEVMKRYAALGIGIAIVNEVCFESSDEADLVCRPVKHLFSADQVGIVIKRQRSLSLAARKLIRLFDPDFPDAVPS
jgi:DNA-binding transcriptional LysR family regulator